MITFRKLQITLDPLDDNYLPSDIVVVGGEHRSKKVLNTLNLNW